MNEASSNWFQKIIENVSVTFASRSQLTDEAMKQMTHELNSHAEQSVPLLEDQSSTVRAVIPR